MKRLASTLAAACLLVAAFGAAGAQADFGINNFGVAFTNEDGTPATLAGTHPFAMTTTIGANVDSENVPEGWLRDVFFEQIPGLVGDTTAYKPPCSTLEFLELDEEQINNCPLASTVGINAAATSKYEDEGVVKIVWSTTPIFTLAPPPGVLLRLGFRAARVVNVIVDIGISDTPPYNPVASVRNTPQLVDIYANKTQLWGNPSDLAHDGLRGVCGSYTTELPLEEIAGFQFEDRGGSCPVAPVSKPLLTLPTDCSKSLRSSFRAVSWGGRENSGSALTPPFEFCGALAPFSPSIGAAPTSRAAESPTGLDLSLDVADEGLTSVEEGARSQSAIRRVALTLPEGMTANPSVAEGLEVCSEADLERETLAAAPGQGCPQASKLGTVEVESPLVGEPIHGALFQATPYENLAEDSLIAFYIVLKNPQLGIIVKQPAKVVADPRTGQLQGITEEIPQLPFSHFRLHFREGGRSPLVSPPVCGHHEVKAEITPWSGGEPIETTSSFEIVSGPDEGPCPSGGQPFEPGFAAGSANNAAGSYSPFSMRLTRRDGDQDLTRFDATLPKGMLARLAGVDKCPDAQIALAEAKTGRAELASPSCPLNSRIGGVSAGAGVGSQLTYVRGDIYLAGPFGGAPLSVVAIVPAVAGPFDVGTVVVRQALVVDPVSGEVTADGARSQPLPHILAGIPLRVRDIQVHVDRSGFTINPTSCAQMATTAAIWGGGGNPFSALDDSPVSRSARFQAASCASLGFKPRLGLRLKGGTRRGAHPAFRAVLRPRQGDANTKRTIVRLPRSAFLEQAHIRTVCTRVQFAADACPKGSVYGHVVAYTPLLDQPLRGPAYLRSSSHKLPDLVFDLHGIVDIEASARIDSIHGGIRASFASIPDAPLSKVIVNMQGGKKGLIVNSRNLCATKNRAAVRLDAHNGKRLKLNPVLQPRCKRAHRAKRSAHRRAG